METDPVCGMVIDSKTAAGQVEHEGKTYYFCSVKCMADFRANPGAFLKRS